MEHKAVHTAGNNMVDYGHLCDQNGDFLPGGRVGSRLQPREMLCNITGAVRLQTTNME